MVCGFIMGCSSKTDHLVFDRNLSARYVDNVVQSVVVRGLEHHYVCILHDNAGSHRRI